MKNCVALACMAILSLGAIAQETPPSLVWRKTFGGQWRDAAYSVTATTDGNFVIVGETNVDHSPVTIPSQNIWAIKIDANGALIWQKTFGGYRKDVGRFVTGTPDGGCILTATTESTELNGFHGEEDIYVVKLDRFGNMEWDRCYGGPGFDAAQTIRNTQDGGYIFTATVGGEGGDVSGMEGGRVAWVVKTDNNGAVQWQKCFGNAATNEGQDVQVLPGGGYMLSLNTSSLHGNFPPPAAGTYHFIVKLDDNGNLLNAAAVTSAANAGLPLNGSAMQVTDQNRVIAATGGAGNCPSGMAYASVKTTRADYSGSAWNMTPIAEYYECSPPGQPQAATSNFLVHGAGALAYKGSDLSVICGSRYGMLSGSSNIKRNMFLAQFAADGDPSKSWKYEHFEQEETLGTGVVVTNGDEYIVVGILGMADNLSALTDIVVMKFGKFNLLKGTVFRDLNSNNTKEANEPYVSNLLVKSEKGSFVATSRTHDGVFYNVVGEGTFITSLLDVPEYYTVNPATHNSIFTGFYGTDSVSFALKPVANKRDYRAATWSDSRARPGFENTFHIQAENVGTDTLTNRNVICIVDSNLQFLEASPAPQSISGDTLTWNIGSLLPTQIFNITIKTLIDPPPAFGLGDLLESVVMIDTAGDLNIANNFDTLRQTGVGSYDPNDKLEAHGGYISPDELAAGKGLIYTIRFQNTGTDTAFTVVVSDTLDAKLDWSTIQMIDASHPYELTITNDRFCKWAFKNILLPDSNVNEPASHGYVTFRIKPIAGAVLGDQFSNSASIYFDFNLPVKTNTEMTEVKLPPPSPVVSGLLTNYCSALGAQKIKITNLPASGSGITVSVKIDGTTVTVGADSSVSFNPGTLSAGSHTVLVEFSNSTVNRTSSSDFTITTAINPEVDASANITNITSLATNIIVTATNSSGGGTTPLYTFARDRALINITQAESVNNTWTFNPSILSMGDNKIYVRMKTSATCFVVNANIDSILLVRSSVTGVTDPDMPGQVINIYPNPFKDVMTINGLSSAKTYTIRLFNLEGKQLLSKRVSGRISVTIPGQHQAKGIYWLTIYDEKRNQMLGTVKMMKE
jgi:uncharacterized repeat protein (TIGR01451 family)